MKDFIQFTGIKQPEEFRTVTLAHGIAWRDDLAGRALSATPRPAGNTLKARRDRAIPATLLYHALRRDEICKLKVRDYRQERRGVPHLKVSGTGGKTRYVHLHPAASGLIGEYLEAAGHGGAEAGALFRPIRGDFKKGAISAYVKIRFLRSPLLRTRFSCVRNGFGIHSNFLPLQR